MKKILQHISLFLIGGSLYWLIENIFRGYSHPSMFVLGGICFVLIGLINKIFPWTMKIEFQMLIGGFIITLLEFITGCIVNIWLNLNVWNYSDLPLNILGQICIPFSLIWIILSLVAILLDDYIRYWLFDDEKPRYYSIFLKKYY